jgi:hypothetical protein
MARPSRSRDYVKCNFILTVPAVNNSDLEESLLNNMEGLPMPRQYILGRLLKHVTMQK